MKAEIARFLHFSGILPSRAAAPMSRCFAAALPDNGLICNSAVWFAITEPVRRLEVSLDWVVGGSGAMRTNGGSLQRSKRAITRLASRSLLVYSEIVWFTSATQISPISLNLPARRHSRASRLSASPMPRIVTSHAPIAAPRPTNAQVN